MAGGDTVGPKEAGFLDTPTYILAAILFFFLFCSTAFEWSTHRLIQFLKRRKRNGLAQAVANLVTELTLVGLVSLLLVVLQDAISSICVPYSDGTTETWTLINNVRGCDCCLADTSTVSSCFAYSRSCGPDYCNCEGQEPSCVASQLMLEDLLYAWQGDPACNVSACGLDYFEQAAKSPQAETAKSALKLECDGMVKIADGKCGEGKTQLITITALHQVHIFIFVVAAVHVTMGIVMILLASWRLRLWRRMCGDDDEHAQGVRKILDEQASQLMSAPPLSTPWQRILNSRLMRRATFAARSSTAVLPDGAGSPSAAGAEQGAAGALANGSGRSAGMGRARTSFKSLVFTAMAAAKEVAEAKETAEARPPSDKASTDPDSSGGSSGSESRPVPAEPAAEAAAEAGRAPSAAALSQAAATDGVVAVAPASQQPDGGKAEGGSAAPEARPRQALSSSKRFLSRSASIKQGDFWGNAREYASCLLHQFHPRPVSADDLRLMRASFMLFHRVPAGFDFWAYISQSMEDDFSQLVGVSLEMWVTLVIFVLISGPLGWVALIFVALAAVVLVGVNVKIFWVNRHICRGARVNALSSNVFWFGRPDLLLHPVRYLVFLCSFMFASVIFFVWVFGAKSCPFTAQHNAFWMAWLPPWWLVLIIAGLIFVDAAMVTLPCYSLAVQMGSDFKHHMLPSGVKNKLLRIAERIKEKHRQQQEAAVEGSRRAGVLGGAKDLLQKVQKLPSGAALDRQG